MGHATGVLSGLLFGLGLYARYRQDPGSFHSRYDKLLASTGRADAAALAAEFGIDIRDGAFWRSSLDMIRQDVDRFVAMVSMRLPARSAPTSSGPRSGPSSPARRSGGPAPPTPGR